MRPAHKKYGFLAWSATVIALAWRREWPACGLDGALLAVWIAWETAVRQRLYFTRSAREERGWDLGRAVLDLRCGPGVAFIHAGGSVSIASWNGARPVRRDFSRAPLAVLPLADGGVLRAEESRLVLSDRQGRDTADLDFDPPLLRQSYRLLSGPDGKGGALATPWFIQLFDLDLGSLGGRIRYEDAGHYFKYAALGPGGKGLLSAGAFLLEEDAGGSLEARWDWWELGGDGAWERRWARSRESYENSQLRGVQVGGDGEVLCTELWRSGYEFELRRPDGSLLWERRSAERPVLSPSGKVVAWENGSGGLVMSRCDDAVMLWEWTPKEQVRQKFPQDDGSCAVLEGRCLRRFGPEGGQVSETWLVRDADFAAFGPGGKLALAAGLKGAVLRPGRGAQP